MKTLQLLIVMVLAAALAQGQTAGDKITGLYWSPNKDAKIEIYKKGTKYFGRSVWVAQPRKDTENPDKSLQGREVQGIELLTDFIFTGDMYKGGKIYDPESGKTYSCKMNLDGDKLRIRGYIGISLIGRTEIFERIK